MPKRSARMKDRILAAGTTPFGRIRNFIHHYMRLLAFARDQVGTAKLLGAVTLDITGAVARGGILFLVAMLAGIMEGKGAGLPEFSRAVFSDQTLAALLAASLPIPLLLLYSSAASYWAVKSMRRYGRVTQTEVASRFLSLLPWLDRVALDGMVDSRIRLKRLLIRDMKQLGISIETMLRLTAPTVYIVIALATVFYLEPLLSATLLALGSVIVPIIYLLGRRIQKNAHDFYRWRIQEMGRLINDLVNRIDSANAGDVSRIDHKWLKEQPAYTDYLDAFDRNKLASEQMRLTASLFRFIFIVCGLLAFGWLAISGERSWSTLVGFLGGLLFLAAGLQSFFVYLAALIRFYPQTRIAAEVIDRLAAAQQAVEPSRADMPSEITFKATKATTPFTGSEPRRKIKRGELTVVLTAKPLMRHSFGSFLRPLQRSSNTQAELWRSAVFMASPYPLPQETVITAILGLTVSEQQREWLEEFLRQGLGPAFDVHLPDGLATELTGQRWQSLPASVRTALQIAGPCAEANGILFLSMELAGKASDRLLAAMRNCEGVDFLFVVGGDVDIEVSANTYLVASDRAVVGLGGKEWFDAQRQEIAEFLNKGRPLSEGGELLDELLE